MNSCTAPFRVLFKLSRINCIAGIRALDKQNLCGRGINYRVKSVVNLLANPIVCLWDFWSTGEYQSNSISSILTTLTSDYYIISISDIHHHIPFHSAPFCTKEGALNKLNLQTYFYFRPSPHAPQLVFDSKTFVR